MSAPARELTKEEQRQLAEYAKVLDALHRKWAPHPGQLDIGRALFRDNIKQLFLRCARRAGKTELCMYILTRWAATHPGAACYLILPLAKQGREIVWVSGRLHNMIPPELLRGGSLATAINNTEMRIYFANGSFIKVDGSDNVDSLRGLRMDILVIDEFKDCRPDLIDVLRPTLLDFNAPLIVAGTPSDVEDHYVALDREAQANPERWAWFKKPTRSNPYISADLIEEERKRYAARDEMDVFQREYEAEIVLGGKRAIFPMFGDTNVKSFEYLLGRIMKKPEHWMYYVTCDPGTASVFAALVCAINPYDGRVYVLGEVYETNQGENSVGKLWPRVRAIMKQVYEPTRYEEPWVVVYDEAATWFRNEVLDQFDQVMHASEKAKNKKLDGISLLKDLFRSGKMQVAATCPSFIKEIKGYRLADTGQPVKKADHAIDACRYMLGFAHYSFVETSPPVHEVIPEDERKQFYTIDDDWNELYGSEGEPLLFDHLPDDY